MQFQDVTYRGPVFDDADLLSDLPVELVEFLLADNGIVAFRGGLHIRGACTSPRWHSLRRAWHGSQSIAALFPSVSPTAIPFAQDAVGDQFLLDDGRVTFLSAESGDLEDLEMTFGDFLQRAAEDPQRFLGLNPLVEYEQSGARLQPGELLSVYPPYVTHSDAKRSVRAIPAEERITFLASLAAQLRDLPDGATIEIKITDGAV